MRTSLLSIMLFASMAPAMSNAVDFKCKVLTVQHLEKSGKLEPVKSDVTEFSVNRATGLISGGGLTNGMSGQRPTVYNELPEENGYKAITIYSPHRMVDYLEIDEWVPGKEKPFIYKAAFGSIYTGLCSSY